MILFNEGFQNQIEALAFDLNRPSNRLDELMCCIVERRKHEAN